MSSYGTQENSSNSSLKSRAFLRVPLRNSGKVYISGKYYGKVALSDLSVSGLSFVIKSEFPLTSDLEIRFRLPTSFRAIRAALEIKNRKVIDGDVRIGCEFSNLPDNYKKIVDAYIMSKVDVSFPSAALTVSAFFFALDGLSRLLLYIVTLYYSELAFFGSYNAATSLAYGLLLIGYTCVSVAGFLFSGDNGKKEFLSALSCCAISLAFTAVTYVWSVTPDLWKSDYTLIKLLTFSRFAVLILGSLGVTVGILFMRKVLSVSDSVTGCHERARKRKD